MRVRTRSGSALLAAVGAACVVSGCGGSAATGSRSTRDASATSPLTYAGTLTVSNHAGTTMTERYSVGQPEYAPSGELPSTVPRPAAEACNVDYRATIAHSAFSPVELRLSYVQGRLPLDVGFRGSELVTAAIWPGTAAFEIDGRWQCDELKRGNVPVQVGQSMTVPMWIFSGVLNGASRRLSQSVFDTWEFNPNAVGPGDLAFATASGPNADDCQGHDVLMLYAPAPTCKRRA